jgi:pimeloyl-ACP methyl ester carboxylesterase
MSTWVLLRGLTREAAHWGDFPSALQEALGVEARVLSLDLPGNGRQCWQPSPANVAEMAEACQRQLDELNIATPVTLVAMSLGAMVASAWAGRHPRAIAGGVLINTSLRPFSPFHHRLRPVGYPALIAALLSPDLARREGIILRLTTNRPHPPTVLDAWVAAAHRHPVSRRNALCQLIAAARFAAPPSPPALPLLVLASAGDRLVDCRCSRRLAEHWGTAYAEHPSAGHDLPLDDPAWVIERIRRWRSG